MLCRVNMENRLHQGISPVQKSMDQGFRRGALVIPRRFEWMRIGVYDHDIFGRKLTFVRPGNGDGYVLFDSGRVVSTGRWRPSAIMEEGPCGNQFRGPGLECFCISYHDVPS